MEPSGQKLLNQAAIGETSPPGLPGAGRTSKATAAVEAPEELIVFACVTIDLTYRSVACVPDAFCSVTVNRCWERSFICGNQEVSSHHGDRWRKVRCSLSLFIPAVFRFGSVCGRTVVRSCCDLKGVWATSDCHFHKMVEE